MKYGELNLGQIEAMVNKLGGMEGVYSLLSNELVINDIGYIKQFFQVTVDYTQTLAQMIKASKYDCYVDDNTLSKHFPIMGTGQKEVEIALFHFDRVIFSYKVIAEMEKTGYRPAFIEELLALGVNLRKLGKRFSIVALNLVWRVPYLESTADKHTLSFSWFKGIGWSTDCYFAAVHK